MGSLYIGGAQCIYGKFKDEDDWENYDELEVQLQKIASKFSVAISRYEINDEYAFVIMHKKAEHQCFYSGAFDYDMSVEVSDDFNERAKGFVADLEDNEDFSVFHGLNWSSPKVLYFVVS